MPDKVRSSLVANDPVQTAMLGAWAAGHFFPAPAIEGAFWL